MRPEQFRADTLRDWLHQHPLATMEELKSALGTPVEMTIIRKLRELGYHSSYSHRGRYYTLTELAAFDAHGLYHVDAVRFSRFGSLLSTAQHFVAQSEAGYFATELNEALSVECKQALLELVRRKALVREPVFGRYLYCDPQRAAEQVECRRSGSAPAQGEDQAQTALLLFLAALDERQRRWYAGLESLRHGYGGDRYVAQLTGLDVHTIARGRRELQDPDVKPDLERIRQAGAGRVRLEKKHRN